MLNCTNCRIPRKTKNEFKRQVPTLNRASYSYCAPFVLCCSSPRPIGIDIECIDKIPAESVDFFANRDEVATMIRYVGEKYALSALWTFKEALSKYYLTGFSKGIRYFDFNRFLSYRKSCPNAYFVLLPSHIVSIVCDIAISQWEVDMIYVSMSNYLREIGERNE